MAIFHMSVSVVRKAGTALGRAAHHGGHRLSHGAGGKAAYLAGTRAVGDNGMVTDYRGKHGIEHSQLILPGGGTCNREEFWNAVDAHPTQRETAVVARDLIVSFPHEFSLEERRAAGVELATWIAERYQVAVDIGMHEPEVHKGSDQRNYHAHLLISERMVSPDGKLGKVQRELNARVRMLSDKSRGREGGQPTAAAEMREAWERIANDHLERGGHPERIDRRTLKEQGIDRVPGVPRGAAATRALRALTSAEAIREELSETIRQHTVMRADAQARIAAIQSARLEEPPAQTMHADLGSLEAWQRDALGMLARYWAAEDRASDMRRRMRETARRNTAMREATAEENKALRGAARQMTRSKARIREAEEILLKANHAAALTPGPGRGAKARLAEIKKAVDPKILWQRQEVEMEL